MAFASGNIVASQREILGLGVCDLGWAESFSLAEEVATMPFGQNVIAFLDAKNANRLTWDAEYRAVLERQIVMPEGSGIDMASRMLHGKRFPARFTGTAFVPALLTYLARPMRVALIGGTSETLKQVAGELQRHAPWHAILPIADGAFDREESDAVMDRVRAARADILVVSMGSPAQEKWIDRHAGAGDARLVLSVRGLFDALADGSWRPEAAGRHGLAARLALKPDFAAPLLLCHALRHKLARPKPAHGPAATAKAGSI